MKRTAIKRGTKSLKRTSLKKRQKSKEQIAEDRAQKEEMWNMFLEVWNERPHFCEETNGYLGDEPYSTMFHHILPKAKYPQFKLCSWNIALLYPSIHEQCELNLEKCPKTFIRKLLLEKKYL